MPSLDYKKLYKEKKDEFSDLHARMDADMHTYLLEPFVLKDYDNQPIKGVDNTTLASPKILADRVVSVIATAGPIATVTGIKLPDATASNIEAFIKSIFYNANVRNRRRHILPIHNFCTSTATLQGWVGTRNVIYKSGDQTIIDIEPLDMRNCYFEMGSDGFEWVGYTYPNQSKASIFSKYNKEISGKKADVVDLWSKDKHIVFTASEDLEEQDHEIGVPFVIEPVSLIPQLGISEFKNFGESIFATNRDLYPEANKQMTILQTLNSLYFRPPMGVLTEDGMTLPDQYPYVPGLLMALKKGEGFAGLPLGDVTKSAPFAYSIINKEIQLGGLPYSEFGTLDFPLSAIAIEKLEGHRDQVFLPRLQTLSTVYIDTVRMIIKQFVDGLSIEKLTDEQGDEIEFKPTDFKDNFQVTFRMSTTSPEKSISNYTVAQAAANMGMPKDMIYRDILEVEDPAMMMDRQIWEQAGQMVPAIALLRAGESLTRMAENLGGAEAEQADYEAKIIAIELQRVLGQSQATPEMGGAGVRPDMPNLMSEEGVPESSATEAIQRKPQAQNPMEEV